MKNLIAQPEPQKYFKMVEMSNRKIGNGWIFEMMKRKYG